MTIAETMKPFFFLKQTDFFSLGASRNCYYVFSVQRSNLISRNFRCDAMQQCGSFSDVLCLNCSFVIIAAQLL